MFHFSRCQLETDLKIEKEWRQTMEDDLRKEKEISSSLKTETKQIVTLKKVNSTAKCMEKGRVAYGCEHFFAVASAIWG